MTDYSHLNALQANHHRELERLSLARNPQEIDLRTVWVSQLEKEIAAEYAHLGIEPCLDVDMSDEELMRELGA